MIAAGDEELKFKPSAVRPGPLFPNGSIFDHGGRRTRLAKTRMRDPLPNYWTVLKEATPLSRMVLVGGVLLVALLPLAIWKAGFSLLQMIDPKWLPKREELFLASGLALMCFVGLTGLVAPQIAIWMWTWKFGRPALARALLKRGFCAACKYEIGRVPLAKGGLTICPECGAAWKLNAPSSEREPA